MQSHANVEELERAGGVVLIGHGRIDLGAMQQGRWSDRKDWWPVEQRVIVDLEGGSTSHFYDWFNYAFSNQKVYQRYDAEGRLLFADLASGGAFWPPFLAPKGGHERYRRYLPSLLVQEIRSGDGVRLVDGGPFTWRGKTVDAIDYRDPQGERLQLYFARESGLLVGLAAHIDAELIGSTMFEVAWEDYRGEPGNQRPHRLLSWLGDRLLRELTIEIRPEVPDEQRGLPAGLDPGSPPPDQIPAEAMVSADLREGGAQEVADNIWLLRNVRPGFHMMAFEFADFLVAIDAPAGWYELDQIPPHQIARPSDGEALTRKYIRTLEAAIPGKPVRYVALTHHHSDHIGGFRAFAEIGATFLASRETALAVLAAQASDPASVAPKIEIVSGEHRIADDNMALRLIELPKGNPKADGFLLAYSEPAALLYSTSFIYPVPEAAFPVPESVALSRWYVDWLDASGLEPRLHFNIHGQAQVQDWQLQAIRDLPPDAPSVEDF